MEGQGLSKKWSESEEVPQAGSRSSSLEAEEVNPSRANNETSYSGNKFKVDYSIRGTAKCKECKKIISKGELRIGKSVSYKDKYFTSFFRAFSVFS